MRPARIIAAIIFTAAVAVTGCSAQSTAAGPSPVSQRPETAPPPDTAPTTPPATTSPAGDRPATGRCDASALRGSLVVPLDAEARFGTCASVRVQALESAPIRVTASLADRISDPQVAADRLVDAWVRGDRAAARKLASGAVTDQLFGESPPARTPAALPCRLADLALFVCSYPIAERAELTIIVEGGASAGYGVSGIEIGD